MYIYEVFSDSICKIPVNIIYTDNNIIVRFTNINLLMKPKEIKLQNTTEKTFNSTDTITGISKIIINENRLPMNDEIIILLEFILLFESTAVSFIRK